MNTWIAIALGVVVLLLLVCLLIMRSSLLEARDDYVRSSSSALNWQASYRASEEAQFKRAFERDVAQGKLSQLHGVLTKHGLLPALVEQTDAARLDAALTRLLALPTPKGKR